MLKTPHTETKQKLSISMEVYMHNFFFLLNKIIVNIHDIKAHCMHFYVSIYSNCTKHSTHTKKKKNKIKQQTSK